VIQTQQDADEANLDQLTRNYEGVCDALATGHRTQSDVQAQLQSEGYSNYLIYAWIGVCRRVYGPAFGQHANENPPVPSEFQGPVKPSKGQLDLNPTDLAGLQDASRRYRQCTIDEAAYRTILQQMGFSPDDVNGYVSASNTLGRTCDQPATPPAITPVPIRPTNITLPPGIPPVDLLVNPPIIPSVPVTGPTFVLPDRVGGTLVNQTCPELTRCHEVTDAVAQLVHAIGDALIEQVRTLISEAINPIINVQNIAIGQLQSRLDTCQDGLNRCYNRVTRPIQQGLGQCYGYMACCNCPYPTQEQVVYGLQTGNYLQSVGLYPPGQTPQPPPQNVIQSVSQPEIVVNVNVPQSSGQIINQVVEPTPAPTEITHYYPFGVTEILQQTGGDTTNVTNVTNVAPTEITNIAAEQVTPELPKPPYQDVGGRKQRSSGQPFETPFWDNDQVCNDLNAGKKVAPDREMMGFYIHDGQHFAPRWWIDAWGYNTDPEGKNFSRVKRMAEAAGWTILHGLSDASEPLFEALKTLGSCNAIPIDAVITKIISGFISHWTNGALDGIFKGMEYKLNQSCPQEIPSQADLDSIYLSNLISGEYWTCLTEANNNLPILATKVMRAKRKKIDFADALKLYRLGKLKWEEFWDWIRQDGVINIDDFKMLEASAIDIPSVSDLIRMMVRDTGDPKVVELYNLDDQFKEKWSGELEKFGDAQGITQEVARLHWRAHWEYPSSTQAFEMLHRLRPDSKYAQRLNAESIARGLASGKPSPGIFTSFNDVQKLLEINDLAWYWRERLAAIAYRPLTRTDAQRARQLGVISKEDLYGVYQDEGYNTENAQILTDFTEKTISDRKARKSYPKGVGGAVKLYVSGLWSMDQLLAELNRLHVDEEQRTTIVEQAKHDREVKIFTNAITCIQRSYAQGALDDNQAKIALVQAGMDAQLANDNVENLWCKKKGPAKQVTAAKLCEWRDKKLINAEQHLRRLVNLGYSPDDADKIAKECDTDMSERGWNKILKELKRQQADLEKAKKAADAAEKKAERAAKVSSRNGTKSASYG
jgi:hypothetical protein